LGERCPIRARRAEAPGSCGTRGLRSSRHRCGPSPAFLRDDLDHDWAIGGSRGERPGNLDWAAPSPPWGLGCENDERIAGSGTPVAGGKPVPSLVRRAETLAFEAARAVSRLGDGG